jgi:hypothetical protein
MREFWDRVGISASLLCVVHCLATPLMVLSMPVVGEFLSHDLFHVLIMIVVIPVAVWALWNGYRVHRHPRVLWLGAIGIVLLTAAMFANHQDQRIEIAGMIAAGLILASAHWINLRSCRIRH